MALRRGNRRRPTGHDVQLSKAKDQVRIATRMIGVKMGDEGDPKSCWLSAFIPGLTWAPSASRDHAGPKTIRGTPILDNNRGCGPDRSGSGAGFPVPNRTTRVLLNVGASGFCPKTREVVRSSVTMKNAEDPEHTVWKRISLISVDN